MFPMDVFFLNPTCPIWTILTKLSLNSSVSRLRARSRLSEVGAFPAKDSSAASSLN
jgi:hypothetical protein